MIARDVLIVSCAISAGIHAALAPEHFAEGTAAGAGFVAAAIGLAALALILTLRPPNAAVLLASSALLAGLILSYALAVSSGLPVLHPEAEAVDAVALVTKAVEAIALLASSYLLRLGRSAVVLPFPPPKGTLT